MKHTFKLIMLIVLWITINSMTISNTYIDPTGTYNLVSKKTQKGADIYGYSGEIQVKTISENKIFMTFNVNKGAPTYSSGTFVDTLDYIDNKAVFYNPSSDPSCEITFIFTNSGVNVKEKTTSKTCGCGFEPSVIADGFYSKKNAEVPVLRDPRTGEVIE